MRGQNSAVLSGMSLSELNMVAIMDPALHYAPGNNYYGNWLRWENFRIINQINVYYWLK